ncbi:uncharacterized protein LOC126897487 isoform X2 [Daktulosphaira vitifoliae]|uniref:uncharacterized protein LOC126897487 isoform X2 n=1 Tax=Daktulosphaira vitifoliae TaxID=58002 RepID=UPI0021AA331D|nr:uncharacterized protein LOC126897487 isoform X2 [Daktulosphaira vitifoliae]
MANVTRKQDEYNLSVLREQLSLPANKHCFDCHQRGPTYVNVTIGSFVCTSCSGLLRGLTPPHRVKSISMASFSTEEIEFVKSRGNENCQRIWLGTYDIEQSTKDEKQIKDFMIAKYEKKIYYSDPISQKPRNGFQSKVNVAQSNILNNQNLNGVASTITTSTPTKFDIFKEELAVQSSPSFANFDNNPVFLNSFDSSKSIDLNLKFMQPSKTGYFDYLTSNPIHFSPSRKPNHINNRWSVAVESSSPCPSWKSNGSQAPSEDRYAALKDLDCLMKSQNQQDIPPPPMNTSNSSAWSSDSSLNGTWSSQVSENNSSQNPFKDDWQNNLQWTNGISTSQSMGFNDFKPWNPDFSNPFKIGESDINKHSSNPFL